MPGISSIVDTAAAAVSVLVCSASFPDPVDIGCESRSRS